MSRNLKPVIEFQRAIPITGKRQEIEHHQARIAILPMISLPVVLWTVTVLVMLPVVPGILIRAGQVPAWSVVRVGLVPGLEIVPVFLVAISAVSIHNSKGYVRLPYAVSRRLKRRRLPGKDAFRKPGVAVWRYCFWALIRKAKAKRL
jgi:hypothetical protein